VAYPSTESQLLDDERLVRFMDEALLELESFETLSKLEYLNTLDGADHNSNDNDPVMQQGSDDFYSEVRSRNNENRELSLLFPQIQAGTPTDINPMFNATSAALSGSDLSNIDGNNDILAIDNAKANLPVNDAVDDEKVVRARWLLVAAAALYGTNFSLVKLLGDEMPVGISSSLRFGLAALATLPWLVEGFLPQINTNLRLETRNSDEEADPRVMATMYGLEVGLWNSIGYVAQAVGLETTLASESAFLCSMAVVVVPLLDRIAGKRLLPRQWLGAIMALAGVAFLELGDFGAMFSSGGSGGIVITTGDKLSMIQPLTFGLGFWRMEQAMNRFPEEARRMTAAQLMAIFISSLGYGLWTLGVFEPFFDSSSFDVAIAGFQSSLATVSSSFPWNEWATNPSILFSLFWTGCITTALTIYMETLALESLSAAETTLIFSTEPLWGTAFAVAVMGEQVGLNFAVGAGLILTACVYSNLGVDGMQEMWRSLSVNQKTSMREMNTGNIKLSSSSSFLRPMQDQWALLKSGLAGSLSARTVASNTDTKIEKLDEIAEGLIKRLFKKL